MDGWLLLLLLLGVLALAGAYLVRRQDPTAEARRAQADLEDALSRVGDLTAAARTLAQELEQTGAKVAAQATERLRALQSAVDAADKRLTDLGQAQESAPPAHGPTAPAEEPHPSPAQTDRHTARPAALDVTVGDGGARPTPGQGRMSNRYRDIYAMADHGHTVEEIAQQMRMGKGEVQLVLNLRGSR